MSGRAKSFLCINQSCLDVPCQTNKSFLDIDIGLGTRFKKSNAIFIRKSLATLKVNCLLEKQPNMWASLQSSKWRFLISSAYLFIRDIAFVAYENFIDSFRRMLLDIFNPVSNI